MDTKLMFLLFSSIFIMTFQPSQADGAIGTCDAMLGKCAEELKDINITEMNLETECLILKNMSDCLSDAAKQCSNFTIVAKALSDTVGIYCKDDPDMRKKLLDLETCMSKNYLSFAKCLQKPTVAPTDPQFKKQVCDAVKLAMTCVPDTTGTVCGDDGKKIVNNLVDVWRPAVKEECDSGSSITSFFSLILACLLALLWYSPQV